MRDGAVYVDYIACSDVRVGRLELYRGSGEEVVGESELRSDALIWAARPVDPGIRRGRAPIEGNDPEFVVERPLSGRLVAGQPYVVAVRSMVGYATPIFEFSPADLREGYVFSPQGDPHTTVGEWERLRAPCFPAINDAAVAFGFLGWAGLTLVIMVSAIALEARRRRRNERLAAAP